LKILFAWLGRTDIDASRGDEKAGTGPIGRAAEALKFDEVHLLSNYEKGENEPYRKWLGKMSSAKVQLDKVDLQDPTDFGKIYEVARKSVDGLFQEYPDAQLSFHLSPGTSAMTAVWIILAKTRYPAQLLQSSPEAGVKIATVPFDISAEYVPLLRALHHRRCRCP
jgi:sigma54-dependent transcription regulator